MHFLRWGKRTAVLGRNSLSGVTPLRMHDLDITRGLEGSLFSGVFLPQSSPSARNLSELSPCQLDPYAI
jgi:hypothetical protein